MAASDYVPMLVKNHLHLAGRPQMGTRPSREGRFLSALVEISACVHAVRDYVGQGARMGGGKASTAARRDR